MPKFTVLTMNIVEVFEVFVI